MKVQWQVNWRLNTLFNRHRLNQLLPTFKEKPINLEALFTGGNPFDVSCCDAQQGREVDTSSVPFQFTIALLLRRAVIR
jgi:hypothetical protein